MKRLTLMRHANAEWNDGRIADFDRPLSRRGQSEAASMARRLRENELVPDLILASPARRTLQTAEILARELEVSPRHVRADERLYLAGAEEIARVVHVAGPRIRHLMVVGHNPGLSDYARHLAPQAQIGDLVTAGVCSLGFEARTWAGVRAGAAREVLRDAPGRLYRLFA